MARALQKAHYVAFVVFLVAAVLWLIDPSPALYLLSFSALGVLWFVAVIWMWRKANILAYSVAMLAFALYQLPARLFDLPNQVQDLQGVLLALSILGILLYLFRNAVIRYARFHENA